MLDSSNLSPYFSLNKLERISLLIFSNLLCLINSHFLITVCLIFYVLRKERLDVNNWLGLKGLNTVNHLSWYSLTAVARDGGRVQVSAILFPAVLLHVIYQTRETVFHHISKHWEESWKYDARRSIFDEIRGVSKCDETLSLVFD